MTRSSRRLKNQASGDGEEERQQNSEGFPNASARHAPLEEEPRSERSQIDFMAHFSNLAAKLASQTPLHENPSLLARLPPESCQSPSRPGTSSESLADPSSEDEHDFSSQKEQPSPLFATKPPVWTSTIGFQPSAKTKKSRKLPLPFFNQNSKTNYPHIH